MSTTSRVSCGGGELGEILDGTLDTIFGAFLRTSERLGTSGDDALYHFSVDPEGRSALGGIQDAEPAGGSGTDVEESAAGAEGCLGLVDGARDRFALRRNHVGDGAVFGVY
jgi:hypothetical protein